MRLFVAVDPPEPVRSALARLIERGKGLAPDARWVRAEAMHLTLAFLGNMPDEIVPRIEAALGQVTPRHAALDLAAGPVGSFGTKARPRVLWAGLVGALEELAALQLDVEAALEPLGYQPEERPFRPHLTLARAREMRGDAALAAARDSLVPQAPAFSVGELILYRSEPSAHGSTYTALARLPLGA